MKTPLTFNDALVLADTLCAAHFDEDERRPEHCGFCESTAKALMAVDCASRLQALEEFREFVEEVARVADNYSDAEYDGDGRPKGNQAMHLLRDAEELLARLAPAKEEVRS